MGIEESLCATVREAVRSAVREAVGELKRTVSGEVPAQQLELLTVEEITQRWKFKPPTVRGWIRSGRLRAVADVRPYRVRLEEMERFLSAQSALEELPDPEVVAARIVARARRK
jgi:excisionase family DNA binding protein